MMMKQILKAFEPVRRWVYPVLLFAGSQVVQAQWVMNSGPEVVLRDPKLVTLGTDLKMAPLSGENDPRRFFLNYGLSGRAGPFELAEQAIVGSAQHAYTLHLDAAQNQFTLHARAGAEVFGPFMATNGAQVMIGPTPMTFIGQPCGITLVMRHSRRIAQQPKIGLARMTPAVLQALYDLRAKMASVAQRVNYDVADREFTEVPRIYNRATGSVFTPVVKVSPRDKLEAERGGERTAVAFLDQFFAAHCTIQPNAISDQTRYQFWLSAPDEYLLCVMQRVKSPEQGLAVVGSPMAIWLTRFVFDGVQGIRYTLDDTNAASWRNVFELE